jgi:WD40 repeat protein
MSYTTIAFGCRDGKIRLHDTRSGGSSHILTHPYPISKLKRADDETRLVCSGLQDTLFLYDIRSSRPSRSSSRKTFNYENHHYNDSYFKTILPGNKLSAKRRKLNHKAYKNWSQPVLTFEHANRDLLYLDIDVHPRLGLLAAGQDTSTDIGIRISNIWTGKTVREISRRTDNMEYRGPQQHWAANRTLKFMDRENGDGRIDLWTCWNGGIAKFSW